MDRLFLDANVLFSAAHREKSALLRLWELDETVLVTSSYAIEEAKRNLEREEQRVRLGELLKRVEKSDESVSLSLELQQIQLPEKDWPILLSAIASRSTHLLTGDVRHFGPYFGQSLAGVRVLRPAVYLREIGSAG